MTELKQEQTTLIVGGTGKTGRRVAERLTARGLPVRVGSRSGEPPFDGKDRATWALALRGIHAAYVTYYPDLAVPGAADTVDRLNLVRFEVPAADHLVLVVRLFDKRDGEPAAIAVPAEYL